MSSPIFIVGSGRSGTSLLRALLNAHRDIHLGQESGLFRWAGRWPDLDGAGFLEAWSRSPSGALFNPEPVQLAPGAPKREAIAAVLQARAARFGKTRWGDKTPLHALHLAEIQAAFPQARVVAVVRHPVATVSSLGRVCWSSGSALADAWMVRQAWEALQASPLPLYTLRLERLLADPEPALRALLSFLEAPWDPRVLEHHLHADFDADPRLPWLVGAEKPLRPYVPGPVALTPAQVALVEAVIPPQTMGYAAWQHPAGVSRVGTVLQELGRAVGFGLRAAAGRPSLDPARLDAEKGLRWLWSLNPRSPPPQGLVDQTLLRR